MKRLCVAIFLVAASSALPADPAWNRSAFAQGETTAREAFEAAKELGTPAAWNAFLASFPNGFYADLARAYLKNLGESGGGAAAAPAATPVEAGSGSAPAETPKVELGANANLNGVRLLPDDSPWHQDISKCAGRSATPRASSRASATSRCIPISVRCGKACRSASLTSSCPATQKKVPVAFKYADESDPGPYPIPPGAPIEGGPNGDGDRHVLVLDRDNWILYEIFNAFPERNGAWKADSGAVWDLKKNQVRPDRWTSADAAGLPILPGLVRYDEVVGAQAVEHALRFTLAKTRRAYVPPASHWASDSFDENLPPMGMRVRLKAGYDISGFAPQVQVILRALKKYGMILADNGSDNFLSGAPDPRWDPDILRQLKRVTTKDLEVVEMKDMVVDRRR